jgi:hypothetical protein
VFECEDAEERCERRCTKGDAGACQSLAQLLDVTGRGEQAVPLYRRGCELGALIACTNYGAHTLLSDPTCATRLHRLACDGEEPWGCGMYGHALVRGIGIEHDPARGEALLRETCDRLGTFPCSVLARLYDEGTLRSPTPDAVRELYQRACATGDPFACDKVQPADGR